MGRERDDSHAIRECECRSESYCNMVSLCRGIALNAKQPRAARLASLVLLPMVLGACAGLPPGADFPKVESVALANPEDTHLGSKFSNAAREHGGASGFRIITVGVDGFAARIEMIDAAERTLDLQYFIFRGDDTGRMLTDALLRAADRGVRVRVLVDDADTVAGDEQILALGLHPAVEVRVFNPFAYRGHADLLRGLEFLFNVPRLDYRMHNKLLVVDNAAALVGGRNIGNQYFQIDPDSQFADDDVFVAGPVAQQLSRTFDEYWNSPLAIPAQALEKQAETAKRFAALRERAHSDPSAPTAPIKPGSINYRARTATGEPFAGIVSGRLPLVWARAKVLCDSPDKRHVEQAEHGGRVMATAVAATASTVESELLIVTPYFVPADDELKLLKAMRSRNARVRVLTNSLEASTSLAAHAGYTHYRLGLVQDGVELYEVRSLLGNARGSGQTTQLSRYGNYSLHAKLIVFDRQKLFIGSMNFDQRSRHLNTEVGLIIDSAELAQQTANRFEGMTQLANSYTLTLRARTPDDRPRLAWDTEENGVRTEYDREPARSDWQRLKMQLYALLPISSEL